MATIENLMDHDELARLLRGMTGPELIAQHLVQRGALHALETLQQIGISPETVDQMIEGLRLATTQAETIAHARGVELVSED